MADFNPESPRQSAYPTAHTAPTLQSQGSAATTTMHLRQDWATGYQLHRSYLPVEVQYPSNYMSMHGSVYPPPYQAPGYGSPRNSGFSDSLAGMYRPQLPPPSRHFNQFQESLNTDFPNYQATNRSRPISPGQPYPMPQRVLPTFTSPNPPQWHHLPPGYYFQTDPSMAPAASRAFNSNGSNTMRPINTADTASARTEPGSVQFPRQVSSPNRGNSYQRAQATNSQAAGVHGRTRPNLSVPPARRSDQSMSPRTSHRRSFDRYSTDLLQPNGIPEPDDATHTPTHRSRRPRTMMGHRSGIAGFYARHIAQSHPNVPSDSQLQRLKDSLKKQIRSELAEDVSPTCDICQKDYSEKLVEPTESEEIAVELSCKHVFGEHCMHTWFETCKTHKNKLTCPMCRTLLVEPR